LKPKLKLELSELIKPIENNVNKKGRNGSEFSNLVFNTSIELVRPLS